VTSDEQAQNEEALASYVEAQEAQLPALLEQYPGLYSDVSIEGSLADSTGDEGIPAGTYSVVYFDYTFANEMDWTATSAGLEEQRASLDEACATSVFPEMRTAGVTGPLGAVYSYGDVVSDGAVWTHTCTE
jgi:hypothetical protein